MKIGLDVMGGDYAPDATIDGAILALDAISSSDSIVLFGDQNIILKKLEERKIELEQFEIVHAPEMIDMSESPIKSFTQKPESSIARGFQYLKANKIDTFGSAGNSGAMIVGAMYSVKNIDGIIRPCTAIAVPSENGGDTILLDIGTNPDPKPDVLYQFGIIGNLYSQSVYKIDNPRVGLLNIGEEEEKGNMLAQSTYKLMKDSRDFNFVGNVEGRDIFRNKVDVIVSDGFTGNILLKQIESIYPMMAERGLTDEFIEKMNFENYGGTPILGINGSVVVGHGISNDVAIKNMIILSRTIHDAGLYLKIKAAFAKFAL
jgi:glycerol-3-phosphate acyltransferase PlsX